MVRGTASYKEARQSCFPFLQKPSTDSKAINHTRMHNSMTLECDSGYELLVTEVAFERLHPSMSPHVRLQLKLGTECLVTLITFEGFVSSVYCLQNQNKPPQCYSLASLRTSMIIISNVSAMS